MTNSKSESRFRYRVSLRIDGVLFRGSPRAPFRAPTNRTGEMTSRRCAVAAGQYEFLQGRQLGIQRVELRSSCATCSALIFT